MTLLAYDELCELVERGVITNVKPEQINASSIDITLGDRIMAEAGYVESYNRVRSLKRRDKLDMDTYLVDKDCPFTLHPGRFILAQSQQIFNLPCNISAEYKLKSSMARIGLEHLNAGWCDAGWHGSALTLELKNMTQYHPIELEQGVGIGQVVFFRHAPVPIDRSYAKRGRYNNDKHATQIKV